MIESTIKKTIVKIFRRKGSSNVRINTVSEVFVPAYEEIIDVNIPYQIVNKITDKLMKEFYPEIRRGLKKKLPAMQKQIIDEISIRVVKKMFDR